MKVIILLANIVLLLAIVSLFRGLFLWLRYPFCKWRRTRQIKNKL